MVLIVVKCGHNISVGIAPGNGHNITGRDNLVQLMRHSWPDTPTDFRRCARHNNTPTHSPVHTVSGQDIGSNSGAGSKKSFDTQTLPLDQANFSSRCTANRSQFTWVHWNHPRG